MSAADHLSKLQFPGPDTGTYYHGSTAALKPGDTLRPGMREARNTPADEHNSQVFMTNRPDQAQFYADSARREPSELPHVYKVEPVGNVQNGPMHDWNLGGEYVTPAARVVSEEQHPYKWPGEHGQKPEVHYERSARRALGSPVEADSPRTWS